MQDATNAKLVFLISLLVETEEMVIHVIGDEVLDRELRFLVSVAITFCKIKVKKQEETLDGTG